MWGRRLIGVAAVMALLAAGLYALLPRDGWSAKGEPSALEAWLARQARRLAMPRSARSASNPVPESPEALARARAHFDVIAEFGRFPHRNAALGRRSTPQEEAYIARGDFVYNRPIGA